MRRRLLIGILALATLVTAPSMALAARNDLAVSGNGTTYHTYFINTTQVKTASTLEPAKFKAYYNVSCESFACSVIWTNYTVADTQTADTETFLMNGGGISDLGDYSKNTTPAYTIANFHPNDAGNPATNSSNLTYSYTFYLEPRVDHRNVSKTSTDNWRRWNYSYAGGSDLSINSDIEEEIGTDVRDIKVVKWNGNPVSYKYNGSGYLIVTGKTIGSPDNLYTEFTVKPKAKKVKKKAAPTTVTRGRAGGGMGGPMLLILLALLFLAVFWWYRRQK